MDTKLIRHAVVKALVHVSKCSRNFKRLVSRARLVAMPDAIQMGMMVTIPSVGNWLVRNHNMPKSPMEHPMRQFNVLREARFQECLHAQNFVLHTERGDFAGVVGICSDDGFVCSIVGGVCGFFPQQDE